MDYPAQRRERLARLLPGEGLDAILITGVVNVTYRTGFSGDTSVLVVTSPNVFWTKPFEPAALTVTAVVVDTPALSWIRPVVVRVVVVAAGAGVDALCAATGCSGAAVL